MPCCTSSTKAIYNTSLFGIYSKNDGDELEYTIIDRIQRIETTDRTIENNSEDFNILASKQVGNYDLLDTMPWKYIWKEVWDFVYDTTWDESLRRIIDDHSKLPLSKQESVETWIKIFDIINSKISLFSLHKNENDSEYFEIKAKISSVLGMGTSILLPFSVLDQFLSKIANALGSTILSKIAEESAECFSYQKYLKLNRFLKKGKGLRLNE
jgi:hypothetical protein